MELVWYFSARVKKEMRWSHGMCACHYKTAVGLTVCSFVWGEINTFQILCENVLTVKNVARMQNF